MRYALQNRSPVKIAAWLLFCCVLTLLCGQDAHAQAADTMPPTEPGQSILESVPWYDASSGSVRSVPVRSQTDDSVHRDSRWLPKPEKVQKQSANTPVGGAAPAAATGTGVSATAWALILLLIIILVSLIIFALTKSDIQFGSNDLAGSNGTSDKPDAQLIERINELPAELRRTDVNARDEAERLMKAGQFDQAIILLFSHQLLFLDHAGYLRLSRGKTNGRYVRETRQRDTQSAAWLRETATAFERSYFGKHELDASWFERLWRQNELLESAVTKKQEAA